MAIMKSVRATHTAAMGDFLAWPTDALRTKAGELGVEAAVHYATGDRAKGFRLATLASAAEQVLCLRGHSHRR